MIAKPDTASSLAFAGRFSIIFVTSLIIFGMVLAALASHTRAWPDWLPPDWLFWPLVEMVLVSASALLAGLRSARHLAIAIVAAPILRMSLFLAALFLWPPDATFGWSEYVAWFATPALYLAAALALTYLVRTARR